MALSLFRFNIERRPFSWEEQSLSGIVPFFFPNRLLVGNGKYCSWEPGRPRQAGALAVVTVAKLLRNSDASSLERKGEKVGGRWFL